MATVFTIVGRLDLTTEANCRNQPNKTKVSCYFHFKSFKGLYVCNKTAVLQL